MLQDHRVHREIAESESAQVAARRCTGLSAAYRSALQPGVLRLPDRALLDWAGHFAPMLAGTEGLARQTRDL
jgi:hypothetical protein